MIEERTINGVKVGFNTATNSYCNLPKAPPPKKGENKAKPIERMSTEELIQKAAELGIDISAATTNKQRAELILARIAENEDGGAKE